MEPIFRHKKTNSFNTQMYKKCSHFNGSIRNRCSVAKRIMQVRYIFGNKMSDLENSYIDFIKSQTKENAMNTMLMLMYPVHKYVQRIGKHNDTAARQFG